MSKVIVGIDPGISHTGVAVIDRDRNVIHTSVIHTYSRWALQRRVGTIQRAVSDVLRTVRSEGHEVELGIVEGFTFWGGRKHDLGMFIRSAVVTGAATAAAILGMGGVDAKTASPAEWRRGIGVDMTRKTTRAERKASVMDAVVAHLGDQPDGQPDHVTDALGLAIFGLD